jgi:hypothetical protein
VLTFFYFFETKSIYLGVCKGFRVGRFVSTISLHESISEKFKGVGGSANTSAMKIYLNYIANKRQIADIQIESGTKNDTKFANIVIDILKKGDLVL